MESTASTGLFHGFSGSIQYLKGYKTHLPVRKRRMSRKHRRMSRKLLNRRLLDKNKSEESSCSFHDEGSLPSCPQQDENSNEIKAAISSICDYDSGMSLAGSTMSSTASSPVSSLNPWKCVAIDCEMVGTGPGGRISELARCSVVNYCEDVIYDAYVRPQRPVTDYRTRWSGITKKLLKNAVPFKTAQQKAVYKMESTASTGLFHGFSGSIQYLKGYKTHLPVRKQRMSRKHRRMSRKLLNRRLLDKNKSEESSCSFHDEGSLPSCPQQDENSNEIKAAISSICDYDSGMSLAGSTMSSTASSPVSSLNPWKCVAIDCEMVGTGPGGRISELARCSVVNYCEDVIHDAYVRPQRPVTDYRTRWGGITKKLLKNAVPFKTAQQKAVYKMESTASTGLFHGFSGSIQYLKGYKTHLPVRKQRMSRKHRRMSRKLLNRRLLDKNKSEESSCSFHDEGSLPSCPQQDENSNEIKAAISSICDYDSGMSLAGSTMSSTASSPVSSLNPWKCVAIDCEMVGTGPGGRISELARCSVVNYCGDVLYDAYVRPQRPVTDYRTRWSGITKKLLKNAVPFKTAQQKVIQLLKGKWVVGHALHNDFRALKFFHPLEKRRDTSEITSLKRMAGLPTRKSPSLKNLALRILQKRIQVGKKGHSSVEDARTSMELYRMVEKQVEQQFLHSPQLSDCSNSDNQYLEDQYWPSDLNEDCK